MEEEIEDGTTIGDLFRKLSSKYPAFSKAVFDSETNEFGGNVSVALNKRLLSLLKALDTNIGDGDSIMLFPTIAGG